MQKTARDLETALLASANNDLSQTFLYREGQTVKYVNVVPPFGGQQQSWEYLQQRASTPAKFRHAAIAGFCQLS
jgi:hypothetical protein